MFKKLFLLAAATSALPAFAAYEINYPADTQIAVNSPRALKSVLLGEQSAAVGQDKDHLLYHDLTADAVFTAEPGTVVKPSMEWTGTWMNGYLYVDLNNDGEFDPVSELVSFTCYDGHNSTGNLAKADGGASDLPAVVVPALKAGDYRMRYVVDWNSLDPKGRNTSDNGIVTNNGAIADVTLRIIADAPEAVTGDYAVNYAADTKITHSASPVRRLIGLNVSSAATGTQGISVGQDADLLLYHDRTDVEIVALHGEEINIAMNWTASNWMNTYFYIDRDNNGIFESVVAPDGTACSGSDLISYSNYNKVGSDGKKSDGGNVVPLPSFYIPESVAPGKYRVRFKLDWDNIDPAGSTSIVKDGGAIVDFVLNVVEDVKSVAVRQMPLNCLLLTPQGQPLNETALYGYDLSVKVLPTLPGFAGNKLIVRHGEGETLEDTDVAIDSDGIALIPGDIITSDIIIYALFEEQEDSEWTKVWGDEFNTEKMDARRWSYHPRYSSTWNRFIAQSTEARKFVNRFEDGYYNSYCVKTPEEMSKEKSDMISGAIYSAGKFTFHYGKAEARVKTRPHTGNFPAFWLMPANNAEGGWPRSGEIDIWEQIDTSNQAHSTVHSAWTSKTFGTPGKSSPKSTNAYNCDAAEWHVYAVEWDENELRFYVDGVHTFTYANQHYSDGEYTEKITWPFYKDFYIILNQSVGNGSWAKNPDVNFEYLTQFDYVRVYKKKGDKYMTNTSKDNGDDPNFYREIGADEDSIVSVDAEAVTPTYYDLNGRRIAAPMAGGIYIRKCGSKVDKIIL